MNERSAAARSVPIIRIIIAVASVNVLSNYAFYHIGKADSRPLDISGVEHAIGMLQQHVDSISTDVNSLYSTCASPDPGLTGTGIGSSHSAGVVQNGTVAKHRNHEIEEPADKLSFADPGTAASDLEERRYQKNLARQQAFEEIDSEFYQETVDETWAEPTTRFIESVMQQDRFSDISLAATECRASSCKMELVFPNSEDMLDKQIELTAELGEELPDVKFNYGQRDEYSVSAVAYFSRQR